MLIVDRREIYYCVSFWGEEFSLMIRTEKRETNTFWVPVLATSIGIGSIVLLALIYLVTRPCVFGKCQQIDRAKEKVTESEQIAKGTPSKTEIFDAQVQLRESIELLEAIPFWSSYDSEAEALLSVYRPSAEGLDKIVTAVNAEAKAISLTQQGSLPASNLQEIQQLWQKAIDNLQQVSQNNRFYPLAQSKLALYRQNLAESSQSLAREQQGQQNLKIARETSSIAELRHKSAQSLANWQLTYATWDAAIKKLKQIPQGTTADREAQLLLVNYTEKIKIARDRRDLEQSATNAYNQALSLEKLARISESKKQWSTAIARWRTALDSLKKIPNNSFQYSQAQILSSSYNNFFNNARSKFQFALKLEQASKDLQKTCLGVNNICDYTIDDTQIKIKLTPSYIQEVWQTALRAKVQSSFNTQVKLLEHIATLEKGFQTISNNTGLPVKVYNPDNFLLVSYLPRR